MSGLALTVTQEAALECNLGITNPGKCDSCKKDRGIRMKFYNLYSESEVEYDLCPYCMNKAMLSVELYLRKQPRDDL